MGLLGYIQVIVMKKVLLYTLAVIFILGLIGACFGESETETTSSGTSDSAVATTEEVKNDEPKSKWEYSESVDEMTDKKSYLAYIVSENEVDFEFPYNGGSNLLLYLRNDPPPSYIHLRKAHPCYDRSAHYILH